jgi:hypothetical protein
MPWLAGSLPFRCLPAVLIGDVRDDLQITRQECRRSDSIRSSCAPERHVPQDGQGILVAFVRVVTMSSEVSNRPSGPADLNS